MAAKPAIAASTAVPWNRELPKDRVRELDIITNRTAMKIIRKRMTFSVYRLLIDPCFASHFRVSFFSTFSRIKTATVAIAMEIPRLIHGAAPWSFFRYSLSDSIGFTLVLLSAAGRRGTVLIHNCYYNINPGQNATNST